MTEKSLREVQEKTQRDLGAQISKSGSVWGPIFYFMRMPNLPAGHYRIEVTHGDREVAATVQESADVRRSVFPLDILIL